MTASTSVRDFYDALASQYHLVFEDWDESVERQASALDGVIRALLGEGRRTVLDVAYQSQEQQNP
jgi:hypothetical protein